MYPPTPITYGIESPISEAFPREKYAFLLAFWAVFDLWMQSEGIHQDFGWVIFTQMTGGPGSNRQIEGTRMPTRVRLARPEASYCEVFGRARGGWVSRWLPGAGQRVHAASCFHPNLLCFFLIGVRNIGFRLQSRIFSVKEVFYGFACTLSLLGMDIEDPSRWLEFFTAFTSHNQSVVNETRFFRMDAKQNRMDELQAFRLMVRFSSRFYFVGFSQCQDFRDKTPFSKTDVFTGGSQTDVEHRTRKPCQVKLIRCISRIVGRSTADRFLQPRLQRPHIVTVWRFCGTEVWRCRLRFLRRLLNGSDVAKQGSVTDICPACQISKVSCPLPSWMFSTQFNQKSTDCQRISLKCRMECDETLFFY